MPSCYVTQLRQLCCILLCWNHNAVCQNGECLNANIIMLSVIILNVIMLCVSIKTILLCQYGSVLMLNAIMLSVITLNPLCCVLQLNQLCWVSVYWVSFCSMPLWRVSQLNFYAGFQYTECHKAECHHAEYRYSLSLNKVNYVVYFYAKCHYAMCLN